MKISRQALNVKFNRLLIAFDDQYLFSNYVCTLSKQAWEDD